MPTNLKMLGIPLVLLAAFTIIATLEFLREPSKRWAHLMRLQRRARRRGWVRYSGTTTIAWAERGRPSRIILVYGKDVHPVEWRTFHKPQTAFESEAEALEAVLKAVP